MRTKQEAILDTAKDISFKIELKPSFTFYTTPTWEVILPIDGKVEISCEANKSVITEGQMAFVIPSLKHRVTIRTEGGKYVWIRLKDEVLKGIFDAIDEQSYNFFKQITVHVGEADELTRRNIIQTVNAVLAAEDTEIEVMNKKLAYSLLLPVIPFRAYSGGTDIVQRTLSVMNNAANIGARLPDIAKKVGCSEEYLVRCFKKAGMETPNVIFKRIKLRFARNVLTTRKISVAEVASMIGFRSVGHFNKLYVAEFGVCPGSDKTR